MKRKVFVLLLGIMLLLTACGDGDNEIINENQSSPVPESSEVEKLTATETPSNEDIEVYWTKTENLGLPTENSLQLESNADGSGLTLIVDDDKVSLEEKDTLHNDYNMTKMLKKDFDDDGIMEIIILFYGGAGGSFQNFRMIKYDGQKWNVIPMDWDGEKDDSFVDVKALKDGSVQIDVAKTGYNKTITLHNNKYLEKEGENANIGVGCQFFETMDNYIVAAYELYADNVGDAFGHVRQQIRLNQDGTRLILGKSSYMSIKKAKKRAYELY